MTFHFTGRTLLILKRRMMTFHEAVIEQWPLIWQYSLMSGMYNNQRSRQVTVSYDALHIKRDFILIEQSPRASRIVAATSTKCQ